MDYRNYYVCVWSFCICIHTGVYGLTRKTFVESALSQRVICFHNREFIAEEDGVVCGRMECEVGDTACKQNKTKTVAWQFLSLPSIEFVTSPMTLLNIKTVAYTIYPNLHLRILAGNEQGLFDTTVRGDEGKKYTIISRTFIYNDLAIFGSV